MNRRNFIRISTLGAGGAMFGSIGFGSGREPSLIDRLTGNVHPEESKYIRTPTYCEICFWKCAGWVYIKTTRVKSGRSSAMKMTRTAMAGCAPAEPVG